MYVLNLVILTFHQIQAQLDHDGPPSVTFTTIREFGFAICLRFLVDPQYGSVQMSIVLRNEI